MIVDELNVAAFHRGFQVVFIRCRVHRRKPWHRRSLVHPSPSMHRQSMRGTVSISVRCTGVNVQREVLNHIKVGVANSQFRLIAKSAIRIPDHQRNRSNCVGIIDRCSQHPSPSVSIHRPVEMIIQVSRCSCPCLVFRDSPHHSMVQRGLFRHQHHSQNVSSSCRHR